jgi:mRNA interferase RelE/StbE
MKLSFRNSFEKDLLRSNDKALAKQVRKLIMRIETASSLADIPNVKKLAGKNDFYRVRLGDYRVGFSYSRGIVDLVRVLHRREIYRYFP